MRAILIASCEAGEGKFVNGVPIELLSFVDRPFFQHVIENLAGQNVREFDVVLSNMPERYETALGEGNRWGITIRYHLARNSKAVYRALRQILSDPNELVLLAHTDRLPAISLASAPSDAKHPIVWTKPADESSWTGWGLFSSDWLTAVCETCDQQTLFQLAQCEAEQSGALIPVERCLSVQTPTAYLDSIADVLQNGFPSLLLTGRAVSPGIWISRNVSLHPRAHVVAPVFIGENTNVGADVTLGPMAVIGSDCLLDRQSVFVNSVVMAGTFVGEGLELRNSIADRGHLHNLDLQAEVQVPDDFILGAVGSTPIRETGRRVMSRASAIFLLAFLWPVLLLTYMWVRVTGGSCVRRKIVVPQMPSRLSNASNRELLEFRLSNEALYSERRDCVAGIKHFLLCFLPGLLAVASGQVALVGVPARTRDQVEAMSGDWRALYMGSRAGLVTEFLFYDKASRSDDDAYAADAYFAAAGNFKFDLNLTGRYFRSLITLF